MSKTIALLVTLDTKDQEAGFLVEQIESNGHNALLLDIGVIGVAGMTADMDRGAVIKAGGGDLSEILQTNSKQFQKMFRNTLIIIKQTTSKRLQTDFKQLSS